MMWLFEQWLVLLLKVQLLASNVAVMRGVVALVFAVSAVQLARWLPFPIAYMVSVGLAAVIWRLAMKANSSDA